jgi:hypothetical protein
MTGSGRQETRTPMLASRIPAAMPRDSRYCSCSLCPSSFEITPVRAPRGRADRGLLAGLVSARRASQRRHQARGTSRYDRVAGC